MGQYDNYPNIKAVEFGEGVIIYQPHQVNLYGCRIGAGTSISAFVEVQLGAVIGERCKISSHSFICGGVTLEDEVMIGHGVMFANDLYPRATNPGGKRKGPDDWTLTPTLVKKGASIGSGAYILPGITIGRYALVGMGSVVTKDVPQFTLVYGNPAMKSAKNNGLIPDIEEYRKAGIYLGIG